MSKNPVKMLAIFLQKRTIQTKATNLPNPSPKQQPKTPQTKAETKKQKKTEQKTETVTALLKKYNFTDTQIAKLLERYPRILGSNLDKTVEPKLRYLSEVGFKGELLPQIVVSNPLVLKRSLKGHLIPSLESLRTRLGGDDQEALLTVARRSSWVLTLDLEKSLYPNIEVLEEEGVPKESILKLFVKQPRCLFQGRDRVLKGVRMAKEFGMDPCEPMFVHSLRTILSMSDSVLERKMEVFKSLGWSEKDFVHTLVTQPFCVTCSEEKLRKSVDFLVNTMKMEREQVVAFPKLVMYSLENRIIPRCNVLMVLQEKKLVGEKAIASWINMTEDVFLKRYINKHSERVPLLATIYIDNAKKDAEAV